MAEAGPIPHDPEDGKVVSFSLEDPKVVTERASGCSLLVDVEFGRGRALYALSQGDYSGNPEPASPALQNSGKLLRANKDGTFSVVVDALNLPTSVDFAGDTAFVVTLTGEVWKIEDVSKLARRESA